MRELSLHILDAMQNSLEAGATRVELSVEEDLATDRLTILLSDNGRGMDQATLSRVFDPFYTTSRTRHVGLGLPLFRAAAQRCDGDVVLRSELGQGVTLKATFRHSHIDRAPLGDVMGALMAVILGSQCDLFYVHRVIPSSPGPVGEFRFDTADIRAELGDVPLNHPAVGRWLEEFILEGEESLVQSPP